jgi:hypothetical protein
VRLRGSFSGELARAFQIHQLEMLFSGHFCRYTLLIGWN